MPTITQGNSASVSVPAGRRIKIETTGEAIVGNGNRRITSSDPSPFVKLFEVDDLIPVRAVSGTVTYTIFYTDVIPFTGNRTLTADDNGKVLRCDDASNVTITVPATLPECFTCGFLMWGAGTVTVAAGSGATKRSSTAALSTQYSSGAMLVAKNTNDAAAEFVLSGGFA
ncbi:hypothetical protein [Bradyrhizobium liaoningense]